jgi:hypothetical protein
MHMPQGPSALDADGAQLRFPLTVAQAGGSTLRINSLPVSRSSHKPGTRKTRGG